MTNPQQICDRLSLRDSDIIDILLGESNGDIMEDDLAELSEDGWEDELVNDFAAKIAGDALTDNDVAVSFESDAFMRDFVLAQKMSRRTRTDVLRERANQRKKMVDEESGAYGKQWYQIGVRSDAPTEEEEVADGQ